MSRDGDTIRLHIDTRALEGSCDIMDPRSHTLAARPLHPGLQRDSRVAADTLLWAALQKATGGTWGGCVYDTYTAHDNTAHETCPALRAPV